jgi:hypothetical protein
MKDVSPQVSLSLFVVDYPITSVCIQVNDGSIGTVYKTRNEMMQASYSILNEVQLRQVVVVSAVACCEAV